MKKTKIIWGTTIVASVAIFSAFGVYKSHQSLAVQTATLQEGSLAQKVFASGRLEATHVETYYAPQSGVVASLQVKRGDQVKKGQVLFSMNGSDLQAQLEIEQNNLKIAENDRDDAKKQYDQAANNPLAPKQTIDLNTLDLRVENAQKTVDHLQKQVADCQVVAKSDGVVTSVEVQDGQGSAEGAPVLTVTTLNEMQVRANLNELDSNKVKLNEPAVVTGDGFSGTYDGTVTFLSAVAEPASQTSKDPVVEMVVTLRKTAEELRPGYNAEVEITLPAEQHVLAPLTAVKHEGDQAYVYEISPSHTAMRVTVKTGKEDDEHVEILSGLKAGDQIISQIPDGLVEGKKVRGS